MDNYHFGYNFQQERIKRNVSPYFNIENSTNTHIVKADQHNSYQLSRQHGLNLRFNPLTPGDFWEKRNLDVFVHFLAWIEATLAPIYPKRHLQHHSTLFKTKTLRHSVLFSKAFCQHDQFIVLQYDQFTVFLRIPFLYPIGNSIVFVF